MRKLVYIVLFTFFISCNSSEFKTERYLDVFELEIPENFEKLDLEVPDACFQYGNKFSDTYVTVVEENIEGLNELGLDYDLKGYINAILNIMKYNLHFPLVTPLDENIKRKNKIDYQSFEVTGELLELKTEVYYYLTFFKGKKSFYYISTWCISESKNKHKNNMIKIHKSFKEIKN
jgi:hypothetical protein